MGYPYIYDTRGEWIGWVTPEREVYSIYGHYVGRLSNDPRILSKRTELYTRPRRNPPTQPLRINVPARVPLAPMMPELPFGIFDVLEEDADLLPPVGSGEKQVDLD
ncbi:MAG: hypothetical protein EHM70_06120 [Chloroflexota bacterium]|nr:MAG: hypothetical protein EHM70_06120 [Chloroflexota bacterium]